ncbi:MAG TPA: hypothetical protein VGI19_00465 [Candidatus Cybelea sp.]
MPSTQQAGLIARTLRTSAGQAISLALVHKASRRLGRKLASSMRDDSQPMRAQAVCDEIPSSARRVLDEQLARARAMRLDPLRLVEIEDALAAIPGSPTRN